MAIDIPVWDQLLDFFLTKATPQEVLDYEPDARLQEWATELLNKNNDGSITELERYQLEQLRQYDMFLAKLKLKAEIVLRDS